MDEVRINQPYTLTLDTNQTVAGASDIKLIYKKPDGTTGEISGNASGGTSITADVPGATNDTAGLWLWHTSMIFSGDTNASIGKVYKIKCKELWAD